MALVGPGQEQLSELAGDGRSWSHFARRRGYSPLAAALARSTVRLPLRRMRRSFVAIERVSFWPIQSDDADAIISSVHRVELCVSVSVARHRGCVAQW